jgi:hypothetical protein
MDEPKLAERLRRLAPALDDSDWQDVVDRVEPAAAPARTRRRRLPLVALVAAALAAAIALVPSQLDRSKQSDDLLSAALAAVSTGPVLHVVLSVPTQDTAFGAHPLHLSIVDVATGKARPVMTTNELWYDPSRHELHQQTRVDGALRYDVLATPNEDVSNQSRPATGTGVPSEQPALAAFFGGYKQALERGDAKEAGTAFVDGRKVIWLRFPPSHAYGVQEIAVDPVSYRPLYLKTLCPFCTVTPPTYRILTLEGVSTKNANFTRPTFRRPAEGDRYTNSEKRLVPLRQATRLIHHVALWAGPSVGGIRYTAALFENDTRHSGPHITKANTVARAYGVTMIYGAQLTAHGGTRHIPGKPGVSIAEAVDYTLGPGNFDNAEANRPLALGLTPIPPEGKLALSSLGGPGWDGQLRRDGLYVEIFAPTRALVLATARALTRTP